MFLPLLDAWTSNRELIDWVHAVEALCLPTAVHLIDGSESEYKLLIDRLLHTNTLIPLNQRFRANSFLARSNPDDVARSEERTFICSERQADAGPTNNWMAPDQMRKKLTALFTGCMRGRTMYVIPFCMGPLDSSFARIGVQITDSAYVACNMRIMTHIGTRALHVLDNGRFVKCLHSVGCPLQTGQRDEPWPCNTKEMYVAHFPESREAWSFGSGYGGNALLSKKSFALRIASVMGRSEGWLAEHMLLIGVTNPEGKKHYIAASFPSSCGKTNLAMLQPTIPGWKVECVGDDIAWLHVGDDGRIWAINPEHGFFGVASGTSWQTNPSAMKSIEKNTIFTNVALTDEKDVWWEGMTETPPGHLISWLGKDWTSASHTLAAHPNSRFTAPIQQCPILDPQWQAPQGVPISAILFGGRRSTTIPLVRQAMSWQQGVFFGASMSSETTAAARGAVGKVRNDPFAMLPFCGYNMADYFAHWLSFDRKGSQLPSIFYVNWFLKDDEKQFIWPGFGENSRVLKWIFDRLEGAQEAIKTPIGWIPLPTGIDMEGLTLSAKIKNRLFSVDPELWKEEVKELNAYFTLFGDRLPKEIVTEIERLQQAYAVS